MYNHVCTCAYSSFVLIRFTSPSLTFSWDSAISNSALSSWEFKSYIIISMPNTRKKIISLLLIDVFHIKRSRVLWGNTPAIKDYALCIMGECYMIVDLYHYAWEAWLRRCGLGSVALDRLYNSKLSGTC